MAVVSACIIIINSKERDHFTVHTGRNKEELMIKIAKIIKVVRTTLFPVYGIIQHKGISLGGIYPFPYILVDFVGCIFIFCDFHNRINEFFDANKGIIRCFRVLFFSKKIETDRRDTDGCVSPVGKCFCWNFFWPDPFGVECFGRKPLWLNPPISSSFVSASASPLTVHLLFCHQKMLHFPHRL